jgi:hypothetical protein
VIGNCPLHEALGKDQPGDWLSVIASNVIVIRSIKTIFFSKNILYGDHNCGGATYYGSFQLRSSSR